jgi:hypothetical protein
MPHDIVRHMQRHPPVDLRDVGLKVLGYLAHLLQHRLLLGGLEDLERPVQFGRQTEGVDVGFGLLAFPGLENGSVVLWLGGIEPNETTGCVDRSRVLTDVVDLARNRRLRLFVAIVH